MTNIELERKLRRAASHSVPDVFDGILDGCADRKGKVITMTKKQHNPILPLIASGAAAALILIAGGLFYNAYSNQLETVVSLDVNPSIELDVSRSERVLKAEAKNDDAKDILGDMKLENTDLDVAVNAIIGSMLKKGYIRSEANSVLISVDSTDSKKSESIKKKLAQNVDEQLAKSSVEGAILTQTVLADDSLKQLAENGGISVGKAALIQKMIDASPELDFDGLSKLTINELNLLRNARESDLDSVETKGSASEKAYIGYNAARRAALKHAGINTSDAKNIKASLDFDDGLMTYEVEWRTGDREYSCELDALTGEILSFESEELEIENVSNSENSSNINSGNSASGANSGYIGTKKALAAAVSHAGLQSEKLKSDVEFEYDDNKAVYEISWSFNGSDYSYEVDAKTGEILSYEVEASDDDDDDEKKNADKSNGNSKKEDAKEDDDDDDDSDEAEVKKNSDKSNSNGKKDKDNDFDDDDDDDIDDDDDDVKSNSGKSNDKSDKTTGRDKEKSNGKSNSKNSDSDDDDDDDDD